MIMLIFKWIILQWWWVKWCYYLLRCIVRFLPHDLINKNNNLIWFILFYLNINGHMPFDNWNKFLFKWYLRLVCTLLWTTIYWTLHNKILYHCLMYLRCNIIGLRKSEKNHKFSKSYKCTILKCQKWSNGRLNEFLKPSRETKSQETTLRLYPEAISP